MRIRNVQLFVHAFDIRTFSLHLSPKAMRFSCDKHIRSYEHDYVK